LAAALPELPYACGLNTIGLLAGDLAGQTLTAVDGVIRLREVEVDSTALERHRADPAVAEFWQARLVRTRELANG
ncbi:MAG TPA: O-succinylbenzoate synthase, partial [Propionibacteriaceae bacterium]|nr:O-succinylbenzoate synthase [Propionibacteriaceae bacterium]